jgi:hypothetical protein
MPAASTTFAGPVVTQLMIAQPDWSNDEPALNAWADGQEVQLLGRPVEGLRAEFECESECYARMLGHFSFRVRGKPDFCNAGGLSVFEDGEWADWLSGQVWA